MSRLEVALRAARDTKCLELRPGALASTVQVFREQFGQRPAVVVADTNTMNVEGRDVVAAFAAADHPTREPFVFTDPNLYAEHGFVEQLQASLAGHDAIPLAVGAGTINDLVKLAAHQLDRPYLCVATAASMDGYTAFGASITNHGSKQTFECPAPRAVIADVNVIRAAPAEMTASGYADLLAKLASGADWIVADALEVEPIDPHAWETVQGQLRDALSDPHGCARGEAEPITRLTEGLMLSGFAMQAHQSSRPASGAEHQFSHLWDMQHHVHGDWPPSHGFKVGVATIAVARLYEELIELPLHELDVEVACDAWPERQTVEKQIDELFAEAELREVARRETFIKYVDRSTLRKQLQRLREIWPELANRLREQLPPSRELAAMLTAAGAPAEPEQIGISRDRLRLSFRQAYHVRRRFTVLDLAARANLTDALLAALFPASSA